MASKNKAGFKYTIEHIRAVSVMSAMGLSIDGLPREYLDGVESVVLSTEIVENLIPTEGLNYILGSAIVGQAQLSAWYIALFEGNYTPVGTVTAATFPATATESIAYNEATRVLWSPGAISAGVITNSALPAVFTMNAAKTIYGCAQSSISTKSSVAGTLISVALFAAPKVVVATDVIRATNPLTITSV